MTEETNVVEYDFTQVDAQEAEVEGGASGGFTFTPPTEGPALFRLREIVEQGLREKTGIHGGNGKTSRDMYLVFELVTPVHAIKKDDGSFVRNHEVKIYLNKSDSDKSKYMKLFNKLNYAGKVATPKGKIPSFLPFITQGFYGSITNNVSEKNGKTYTNMTNAAGEFTIGAASIPATDAATGMPTGEYTDIQVPVMSGKQRVFLWETNVNDATYTKMWESIYKDGTYGDENKSLNFDQDDISNPEVNLEWEGSRAQTLFDSAHAELEEALTPRVDAAVVAPVEAVVTPIVEQSPTVSVQTAASTVEAGTPVATADVTDPLAALGL